VSLFFIERRRFVLIIEWCSLELLLVEAERTWAYSQELLSLSLRLTNKPRAHTLAHNATSRFRRSVKWSIQLLSYCRALFASSQLSAENLLEITIYALILNGRFLRYRDRFEGALIQFCVAHHLLDGLAINASMSRDQALAILFSDEIGPEIRYCAHELGLPKAYDICGIVESVASQHKTEIVDGFDALMQNFKTDVAVANEMGSRRKLGSLMWEGQQAPVRNPELVDVLLKVQEAEASLTVLPSDIGLSNIRKQDKKLNRAGGHSSKKDVAAYDTILLALSDAEVLARKLTEAQQVNNS
jgi:signal recognition particle subunit SRP68